RGLVISTGNKHFKLARSTIDTLRNVIHSDIPIEIIYNGDEDLSKDNRNILNQYKDVYVTDISSFFDNSIVNLSGWAIKPYAILASRFEEVILIDADVIYIRDPLELYEDPDYKEKGTLFFSDRSLFPGPHPAEQWVKSWMIDPLPETRASRFWNEISQHEMESSTVVINKTKNIVGLLSVCKLNERNIRTDVVYKYVYGDKETFWIGFDMARQHYHMNSVPVAYIGTYYKDETTNKICGHLGHMLPNGDFMFWNGHIVKDK
ncbi:glycosyltransferase family 71 protein, partial [Piromyces sp. E2]